MAGSDATRPRARSEARREDAHAPPVSPSGVSGHDQAQATSTAREGLEPEIRSPRRASTLPAEADEPFEARSPQRWGTTLQQMPTIEIQRTPSLMRRRTVRRSASIRPSSTIAGRSKFTLAGPDDTPQLQTTHAPYVHPGYADLNPAYDQPANTKPVWSLAKPLPRVVRPGMVPTKSEILESRVNAELPGENSQKLGLDVDPNDLEKGKVQPTPNPAKLSAQLKDSRAQRENNFLNTLQRYGTTSRVGASSRLSSVASPTSSTMRRRASTSAARPPQMSPTWELEEDGEERAERPPSTEVTRPQQVEPEFQRPIHRPTGLGTIPESRPVSPQGPVRDDAVSMTTLDANDEPDLLEDMAPLMENFHTEDEIFNNHTSWSVVRTAHREFLAELLAVFVQLTIGFCSDLSVTVANAGNPNTTDWAWGFATMMGIYISGGISGAHLNPTISIMLWFFRGFPKRKLPEYWMAQFLGAFIAAFTAYGVYYASIHEYLASNSTSGVVDIMDSFVTSARFTYIDAATAFFNEFLGTAFLVVVVLALGDDQNAPPGAGMNSFIIGLVITVLSMAFARQTGAALNPSRDFGPRLALLALGYSSDLFTNPYWFYCPWAATVCGAFVGGTLYDVCIFTGGESPLNYPWSRTKRAAKKSKRKWKHRLHLTEKEVEDVIS